MKKSFSAMCLRSSPPNKGHKVEEENQFSITPRSASVDIGHKSTELREMVARQQRIIHDLISELEKERTAASSAANEAMSMILRLQRDKAEIQMEARQFRTYAQEKLAHDQQEIVELENLLYQKEEFIEEFSCKAQAYKHRMMSYGITEDEADGEGHFRGIFPLNESREYQDGDHEIPNTKAFGETPQLRNELSELEFRISELERNRRIIQPDCIPKKVLVGGSPRTPMCVGKLSTEYANSPCSVGKEIWPDFAPVSPKLGTTFRKTNIPYIQERSDWREVGNISEAGDGLIDRVCTLDSIYTGAKFNNLMDPEAEYMATPRDLEIQKLYVRLRALEADRELMRQAIVSMGSDKAQMVLLKEIAQNWCRGMSPARRTMPMRKQAVAGKLCLTSVLKWIITIIFSWRRKLRRCRYPFGLSADDAGLLLLLDKGPRVGCPIFTTNT